MMTPVIKRRFRRLAYPVTSLKLPSWQTVKKPRLSWLFVFLYIILLLFISFGPLFRLQRFMCHTNTGEPCPDYVIPELAKKRGEIAYLTQTSRLVQTLGQTLPQADKILVEPMWPNTLNASITWQPGIANLQIPASTSAILVGKTGQLITLLPLPDPTLPTIIASSAADLIISDQLTDTSLQAALELIKLLGDYSISFSQIDVVSPIDIRVSLSNQKIGVFTSLKSINVQVNTLHLILSDSTINPNLPIIDVRYDRPALKPALPT